MAGAEGFEPSHAGTKNQCLTAWLRPISAAAYKQRSREREGGAAR